MEINDLFPIKGSKKDLRIKEVEFFDWLQQTWEHNKPDIKTKKWNDSEIRELFKAWNISESHNTKKMTFKIESTAPENTIYFKTPNGNKVSRTFMGHLRNAYAHLYMEIDPENNNLHLQDWKEIGKTGLFECTMDAKIPFDFLEKLTKMILKEYDLSYLKTK